jgi:hypothetical protein
VLSPDVHTALTVIVYVIFLAGMITIVLVADHQPPENDGILSRAPDDVDSEPPDLTLAA